MQKYILCYLRSVSGKKICLCYCGSKRFRTLKNDPSLLASSCRYLSFKPLTLNVRMTRMITHPLSWKFPRIMQVCTYPGKKLACSVHFYFFLAIQLIVGFETSMFDYNVGNIFIIVQLCYCSCLFLAFVTLMFLWALKFPLN